MKNTRRDDKSRQRTMFKATCTECGSPCEVPFQPTGDKPVYCNNCFAKRKDAQTGGSGRRDFDRSRNKQMFSAICDKCGQKCEVPFQPTAGKPIYCNQCFSKGGSAQTGAGKGDQLGQINAKLDKIISALIAAKIIKAPKEEKQPKSEKKPEENKAAPKAAGKKKTAAKKKK